MNLKLKAIYFCSNSSGSWGKGYTIKEAKKHSFLNPKLEFIVWAAILNDPDPDQMENIKACITANNLNGYPEYYRDNREAADTELIDLYHVGWIEIEKYIKPKLKIKNAK